MKHLLFIITINLTFSVFSQGNLQFNNVYTYSGFLNGGASSPAWTVPNGKIWKIDFFTIDWLVINNNKAANSSNNGGVVWLKTGDQIYYSGPFYGVCCGGTTNYMISIIEDNLIP
jgi:hypothetical protein